MEEGERGHHLRDGVGVHVDRLDGNERAETLRALQDDLRDKPRIYQPVVCVDEHAAIAGTVTPLRDLGNPFEIGPWVLVSRGKAGREDLDPMGGTISDSTRSEERRVG